jgi:quercetin dioxygenase-like cupin family protein
MTYKAWATDGMWFDVVGPKVKVLSDAQPTASDFSVIEARLAPGVFVPLHSHEDREAFFVISGVAQAYVDNQWHSLEAGQSIDIGPNKVHAWRNSSDSEAHLVLITTEKMRRFFEKIARPLNSGIPSPDDMAALGKASEEYGYRLASPEENMAIGIAM